MTVLVVHYDFSVLFMSVMGVHKTFAYGEGGVSSMQFFGGIFGIVSILQSPHAGKQGY